MSLKVSRRRFMGGAAAALGYMGLKPGAGLLGATRPAGLAPLQQANEYDSFAKLSSNENPYGPSDKMLEAMNTAWKYSNRYGYPDGNIRRVIAEHHGVGPENILLGAGSGETLEVVGHTFLEHKEKVIGVTPTFRTVYGTATNIDADVIELPLDDDHSQNIDLMIETTRRNYRDVGLVYLCNPNNPTGMIVPASDVRRLLDGIPEDVPVLIDEAYHHFIEDSRYETSVPYVLEGRNVIVARTFSKIYGMAGMRLGYGIAPADLIQQMRAYSTGSVNALVKWGGVAALSDPEGEAWVKKTTLDLRKKTVAELEAMGYECLPSECNFFMVKTGRPVQEVRSAFRERGVLVGRPFPPMLDFLRVSIGTEDEMKRFMAAWKEILPARAATGNGNG
ncbi:MAG: aminotransferase class I/II-fold pyridoxal phosphate-dependent enzyme [Gemmatimonadota bacterium]|nr:aminotransferase class I/II-fold pyridoxal phosphate-dependent enzyme [Gemmatimonadota bacterium]